MNAADFRASINLAWKLAADEMKLVRTVSSLHSLPVSDDFNDVALDAQSSYKDIYIRALSRSYYNFILNDYSMFQFSLESEEEWRLAYLPNPWISGVPHAQRLVEEWEALEQIGQYDQEEVAMLLGELPYYSSIPAIRFEYSARQYVEFVHPGGHFHIGRDANNRWPGSRKISPMLFVMNVLKMYYGREWKNRFNDLQEGCLEKLMIDEVEKCGVSHYFSDNEGKTLHFSAR